MKVVVPFAVCDSTWALGGVQLALKQDGHAAEFKLMSENESYYNLMRELWLEKETFCVVEHDIVVWPGALDELAACPEPWCVRPYYCSVGWIVDGLGCAKFSKEFLELHQEFFEEPFPSCCRHDKYFCGLDRLIAHRMKEYGISAHVHLPGVTNLNARWT